MGRKFIRPEDAVELDSFYGIINSDIYEFVKNNRRNYDVINKRGKVVSEFNRYDILNPYELRFFMKKNSNANYYN